MATFITLDDHTLKRFGASYQPLEQTKNGRRMKARGAQSHFGGYPA